ncbi:helix-turn-helix domain-containing protein [Sphingomonas solaris]|nr:helix-turn-helix domain-containing protein [Sphingomonas solaris]
MSIRIMSAVWSLALPDSEKIVLLALADCANDEGVCWPSMASLAAKCSKTDRTVQAAVKSLVVAGHLSRTERPGKGVLYTVHPDRTPETASGAKPLRPESTTPPKPATPTPEAASDKPSRTTISPSKATPSSEREGGGMAVSSDQPQPEASGTMGPAPGSPVSAKRWKGMPPPAAVSDEQWAGFLAMRRAKRQTLTPRAYELLCRKLVDLTEAGWPPGDLIDLAVERNWTTVYEPRNERSPNAQRHHQDSGRRDGPVNPMVRAAADDIARRHARGERDLEG